MKLSPVLEAKAAPDYPVHPRCQGSVTPHWKKIAATLGAALALWLPACSSEEEPCDVREPGIMARPDDPSAEVKPPEVQDPEDQANKPPEQPDMVVVPGQAPIATPPPPPPPRTAGVPRRITPP